MQNSIHTPQDAEFDAAATRPAPAGRTAALITAAIVSFSLTLFAASLGVLSGLVPLHSIAAGTRLDIGALLLMVPVLALVLGIVTEAARFALKSPDLPQPRRRQVVAWSPTSRRR